MIDSGLLQLLLKYGRLDHVCIYVDARMHVAACEFACMYMMCMHVLGIIIDIISGKQQQLIFDSHLVK